jgi:hypothetical protein
MNWLRSLLTEDRSLIYVGFWFDQIEASMAMTARVRSRAVIFVLLAVTIVRVQGRLNPDSFDPLIPIDRNNPGFYHNPFPESTAHVATQPTNLDESSRFWASAQDAGGFNGRGVANEHSYAMDETTERPSDEFFTPEQVARTRAYNEAQQAKFESNVQNFGTPQELARAKAFNEAQQARFEHEMRNYQASGADHEYPKVYPDGTVLLWVNGPEKTTPEEIARFEAAMGKRSGTSTAALPGSDHTLDFQQPDGSHGAFSASYNKP